MKSLLLIFSIFIFNNAYAKTDIFNVRCFAPNGKEIYNSQGEDLLYNNDYIEFYDTKHHHEVFIFGECILTKDGEHILAKK